LRLQDNWTDKTWADEQGDSYRCIPLNCTGIRMKTNNNSLSK